LGILKSFSLQIIEELEDRLGESMNEILVLVKASLSEPSLVPQQHETLSIPASSVKQNEVADDYTIQYPDVDADGDIDMEQFDDTGEGVGVEGDLDVEEE
jgi:hypothetical protein